MLRGQCSLDKQLISVGHCGMVWCEDTAWDGTAQSVNRHCKCGLQYGALSMIVRNGSGGRERDSAGALDRTSERP